MSNYKIFAGSSHPQLAQSIANACDVPLGRMKITHFSCGEIYVKFAETCRGQEVFLVQTGRTGDMNQDLIELFLMIDAARQSFAEKIHVILPYYPYARQDKIHEPREGISARLFAKLISQAGADHVITVHLHSDQTQGFFDCPVDNLNPRKMFVDYFRSKSLSDAVIVAPDVGSAKVGKKFADDLNVPLVIMHKQRPEHNVSEVTHVIGDVAGKTPIIIDDMIDTAGSVCGAKKALIQNGANPEVYLASTHPIFSGPARERLTEADFKEIICTDSLPVEHPPKNYQILSLAPLLGEVIKSISQHKSVSGLYL
jgi:ribose-phosphate pyrophosphokinase